MYYILYIDRLFFLNFCMDFFALSLMNAFLGRKVSRFRMILSSFLGAVGYIAVLFLPTVPYFVKVMAGFVVISILMVWMLYPGEKLPFFIRALCGLYGFSFLLGGALIFFKKYIPSQVDSFALTVLLPATVVYIILKLFLRYNAGAKNDCEVTLSDGEKQIKVKAFVDSGNMLTEPVSKKPVSIAEATCLRSAGLIMPDEKCKVIPYHSVGKQNGILMGYEFPEMIICVQGREIKTERVIVAISETNLFSGGKYQMILHPRLLEGAEFQKTRVRLTDKKDWRDSHDIENSNV